MKFPSALAKTYQILTKSQWKTKGNSKKCLCRGVGTNIYLNFLGIKIKAKIKLEEKKWTKHRKLQPSISHL